MRDLTKIKKSIRRRMEPLAAKLSVRRLETRLRLTLLAAGIIPVLLFTALFCWHINTALREEEQKAALAAAQNFASAFENEKTALIRQVTDYGIWNEMHYHARFPDPRWFEENLTGWVPAQFDIPLIRLADPEGRTLAQAGPVPLPVSQPLASFDAPKAWVQMIEGSPYIIAASPVLPSNRSGPPAGRLFFARKIDENMLNRLFTFPNRKAALVFISPGAPGDPAKESREKAIGNLEIVSKAKEAGKWFNNQPETKNAPQFLTAGREPVLCFPIETNAELSLFLLCSLPNENIALVRSRLANSLAVTLLLTAFLLITLRIFFYRQIINPLTQLANFLLAQTYWSSQPGGEELFSSAPAEIQEISRQISDALRTHAVDALTGLFNRRSLEERLTQELKAAVETGRPFSIIMLDLDRFKHLNDCYGHLVGDEVLRHVAAAIKSSVRAEDFVARYGGDEIIAVLPQTDYETASAISKRLAEKVNALSFSFSESSAVAEEASSANEKTLETFRISVSVGIATYPLHGETPRELISHADRKMLQHKQRLANPSYLN